MNLTLFFSQGFRQLKRNTQFRKKSQSCFFCGMKHKHLKLFKQHISSHRKIGTQKILQIIIFLLFYTPATFPSGLISLEVLKQIIK